MMEHDLYDKLSKESLKISTFVFHWKTTACRFIRAWRGVNNNRMIFLDLLLFQW